MKELSGAVAARRFIASGEARTLRKSLGLSLSEVAKDLGMGVSTLSAWERGVVRPAGRSAVRYHELLTGLERET